MNSEQELLPTELSRDEDGSIRIGWSDQTVSVWNARQLRDACPCATCREKKRGKSQAADGAAEGKSKPSLSLPVLRPEEARPLTIAGMRPVGAYAYNISFSDGHSSGLYPLALLHRGPSRVEPDDESR